MNIQLLVRRVFLVALDMVCVVIASGLALVTRFEFKPSSIPAEHLEVLKQNIVIFMLLALASFCICRMYSSLWEYAGVQEAANIIAACVISGLCQMAAIVARGMVFPRSYYPLYMTYMFLLLTASRASYRILRVKLKGNQIWRPQKQKHVMVIGAGEGGRAVVHEIRNSSYLDKKVSCLIDDDPMKKGCYFYGVRVFGNRDRIREAARKYKIQQIIVAIPSASAGTLRPILDICKDTGCELQILPGIYQMVNGEVQVSKLRPVSIDDLLGRDEVSVDMKEILGYVSDKVILVTGGGGSIGSELCRQLAAHQPKQLIIFDIYENNADAIQQELKFHCPDLNLVTLIGSIRDEKRLNSVFEAYGPDLVFHAAAHKHVPLMEDSPNEAIKNNVLGTYQLAAAADRYHVKKFVQISTDKAVNPTNIMGASKRICEMIIQTFNRHSETEFVAVRFGNVLGSNGSVIPLFKRQIAVGGPVTVTHPDIIRYFMTIQEAASLVLQAGAYAKGGEIFVLDMGEPVKILDLARNMIRLSGLEPGRDIEIKYTGLRPGEKLYEELLMDEEGMTDTPNKLIHIGHPIDVDEDKLYEMIRQMKAAVKNEDIQIRDLVKEIVPTYREEQAKAV